jgi:hypothetical protein
MLEIDKQQERFRAKAGEIQHQFSRDLARSQSMPEIVNPPPSPNAKDLFDYGRDQEKSKRR